MTEKKCPTCGCKVLYVKDPEDEYETYEFECKDGKVCFDANIDESEAPAIEPSTEAYCTKCAWHDKFKLLKQED